MPFTSNQFFGVFAPYNRTFIVVVVALWLASAGIVAFVSRDPERRSRTLSLFLAVPRGLHALLPYGGHVEVVTRSR